MRYPLQMCKLQSRQLRVGYSQDKMENSFATREQRRRESIVKHLAALLGLRSKSYPEKLDWNMSYVELLWSIFTFESRESRRTIGTKWGKAELGQTTHCRSIELLRHKIHEKAWRILRNGNPNNHSLLYELDSTWRPHFCCTWSWTENQPQLAHQAPSIHLEDIEQDPARSKATIELSMEILRGVSTTSQRSL